MFSVILFWNWTYKSFCWCFRSPHDWNCSLPIDPRPTLQLLWQRRPRSFHGQLLCRQPEAEQMQVVDWQNNNHRNGSRKFPNVWCRVLPECAEAKRPFWIGCSSDDEWGNSRSRYESRGRPPGEVLQPVRIVNGEDGQHPSEDWFFRWDQKELCRPKQFLRNQCCEKKKIEWINYLLWSYQVWNFCKR